MITNASIYNIDPFYSNRLLDIKVKCLNVFSFLKKLFSAKSFKTGVVYYFNMDMGKMLTHTEGILKVIPEMDIQRAKIVYPAIEKALKHFIRIYNSLEHIRF